MSQKLELFPAPNLICGNLYYILFIIRITWGNAKPFVFQLVWAMFSVQLPVLRNYTTLDHPSHSPDLTPSYYHSFATLKQNLGGNRFEDDGEVKTEMTWWLITQIIQDKDFCQRGIEQQVRGHKCVSCSSESVEKRWDISVKKQNSPVRIGNGGTHHTCTISLYHDRPWHSEDRESWYILIIKPTRCTNFSNLFLE